MLTDLELLRRALRCCDLTSLESTDTPQSIASLTARAVWPGAGLPAVAAVCVYPMLAVAAAPLTSGTGVKVAVVAGAFPHGLVVEDAAVADVAAAAMPWVDEIDIVLNRSLVVSGQADLAEAVMAAQIQAAGDRPVKVILETGELTPEQIRVSAHAAINAGASFLKTSTGKTAVGATPEAVSLLAEVIAEHHRATGLRVGLKVSGGVRTSADALAYMRLVEHTLGEEWIQPDLFRIGASSLLNDLIASLT